MEPSTQLGALTDRLPELFRALRQHGFACAPDQYVAANDLLLVYATDGRLPDRLEGYQALLAPLFCSSPDEQADFYRIFARVYIKDIEPEVVRPADLKTDPGSSRGEYLVQTRSWPWVVVGAAVSGVVLLVSLYWPEPELPPPPPKPDTGKSEVSKPAPGPVGTPIAKEKPVEIPPRNPPEPIALSPADRAPMLRWGKTLGWQPWVIAFAWLAWRWRRRRVVLRRFRSEDPGDLSEIRLEAAVEDLFHAAQNKRLFDRLRSPPRLETRRLHEEKTVDATVRANGLFRPVYRERRRTPGYLVLIERWHRADHAAALTDELCQTLKDQGLRVHPFYYRDSPRRLSAANSTETDASLAELATRHEDDRLWLAGDAGGLFFPLSGRFRPEVARFSAWPERALLMYGAVDTAPYHAGLLAADGFAVGPLSRETLARLSRWYERRLADSTAPPPTVEAPAHWQPPAMLTENPERWVEYRPPRGCDIDRLIKELKTWLGPQGYYLLCAMAAYPELHFGLTLALDKLLNDHSGSDTPSQRLARIAALPWARHGYIPDYLREKLLSQCAKSAKTRIAQAYTDLFEAKTCATDGRNVRLPIARYKPRLLRRYLRDLFGLAPQDSPLNDRLFAHVLLGQTSRTLDFELPRFIGDVLRGKRWVGIVAVLLVTCLFTLGAQLGMAWLWDEGAMPYWEERRVGEIKVRAADYSVQLIPNEQTRVLTARLRSTLQGWGYTVEIELPRDKTGSNQVVVTDEADRLIGEHIADRLRYLTYQTRVVVKAGSQALPIQVYVAQTHQFGSVFRATLGQKQVGGETHDVLKDGTPGPVMVRVPAGCFQMGSNKGDKDAQSDEFPSHEVCFNKEIAIGRYEVTFDEYDRFAEQTKREFPNDGGWGRGKRPVINVSWEDAQAYAQWLSDQTGSNYRLPTEAEWEYVARAGTTTAYWWGNDVRKDQANCDGCGSQWDLTQTAPVGSFGENPFGLHDTAGNVYEWLQDCWHANYDNAPTDGSAWKETNAGDCGRRVIRGGSWYDVSGRLRSAFRNSFNSVRRANYHGFRLAQDP